MPDDPSVAKRVLRAELRERRRNMPGHERELATEGFTARLEELIGSTGAESISCYLSMPTEPNTRPFVEWAEARGIRVLFPVTREDGLLDWTVGEAPGERIGPTGVPEAEGELLGPMAINDVDLILVPAAAVDATGLRLGWGRGYFDKTLGSMGKCPPVYAVVFDTELVETVPREVHDQPVDGVVTPTRIVAF
ncbi:5-formyltetrahydrofolate cyclo-ligase [Agromyces sp. LHK192]|uniref:5-formyltetrahydrofolate cyclo-ligase n=1 Tax=Agromyces sp. LHK192 TaxID=2498704 RepID=UPI000FD9B1E7|nr:5-formyltetrahydrofolate cyclo-ligase [Agromyces sp. LHK192]